MWLCQRPYFRCRRLHADYSILSESCICGPCAQKNEFILDKHTMREPVHNFRCVLRQTGDEISQAPVSFIGSRILLEVFVLVCDGRLPGADYCGKYRSRGPSRSTSVMQTSGPWQRSPWNSPPFTNANASWAAAASLPSASICTHVPWTARPW